MNIIQYSKLENIAGYLERWNVEKVIVHPEMEEEVRKSKLADVIDEKNILCFSPETECEERKVSAGKVKTAYGKEQTADLTPAQIIVEKLKESGRPSRSSRNPMAGVKTKAGARTKNQKGRKKGTK